MPKIGRPRAEVVVTDDERGRSAIDEARPRESRGGVSRPDRVGVYRRLGHGRGAPVADDEDDRGEVAQAIRRAPARGAV